MSDEAGSDEEDARRKPVRPPPPRAMPVSNRVPSSLQRHLEELSGLLPQRVRWFYNEDKKWLPFCGLDSLRIEQCYRRLTTDKNSEPDVYEVCTVRGELYDVDLVQRVCKPVYWKADPVIICRGTWFKGSPNENNWTPISEDEAQLIEDSHQAIWRSMGINPGSSYDKTDANSVSEASESKNVLGRLQLNGQYVEWNDITEVWLHSEGMTSKIIRGMMQKMGGSTGVHATPLHRGYHTESCETDCPADIAHLVFVVHGIGQLMHNSINGCCQVLRCGSKQMEDKYFKEESKDGRVEFVPVEWRSSLKLDEGVIDLVTPHTVRGVRNLINTSMMDIMYYTSPFYREEIIACVKNRLNKLYTLFMSRHPNFKKHGSVSIMAHSLGSVIVYDILKRYDMKLRDDDGESSEQSRFVTDNLNYLSSMEECRNLDESAEPGCRENPIQVELAATQRRLEQLDHQLQRQLDKNGEGGESFDLRFKVENCFLLGSPLAVFFTLRGFRPGEETENDVLPQVVCKKLFNIYDHCDPVAYRLEPLFREGYSSVEPVHIKSHSEKNYDCCDDLQPLQPDNHASTGNWILYALLGRTPGQGNGNENGEEGPSAAAAAQHDWEEVFDGVSQNGQTKANPAKGWFSRMFSRKKDLEAQDSVEGSENGQEQRTKNKVLSRRVDYILCENRTQYWSALTSHLSYWGSLDLVRFVLYQTYTAAAERINS